MIFSRLTSVVLALSVLLLSSVVLAASDTSTDSLTRLTSLATAEGVTLDDGAKNNVQNSCQGAQVNLKSIRQKEQRIQRERLETYTDIQNEIDAMRLRLTHQGVETGGLARILMGYRELSDQYDRLSKAYYEALNDTANIDCRESPEAFVAGLSLLRQKRAELLKTTVNLRDFVFSTVHGQFDIVSKDVKV